MKRSGKIVTFFIAAAMAFTLASCAKSPQSQGTSGAENTGGGQPTAAAKEPAESRVINIGYNGGLCQAPVAIAHEKGFFAEEGLQTALTKSDNARDAIAGGKIDTSAGMIAAWLKPVTNGVDIVFTVGLHTGCTSAIVLKDSPINSFADAKGKSVGISGGIGGVNHNIGYRMIAHDKLKPEDFQWRDFAEDQLLLILEKKEADVAIVGDQLAEKWVQEGKVRRIRSTTLDADFHDEACCILGISGKFMKENPRTAEKISRAVYKAALWVQENKLETAKLMIEKGHISGTPEYAKSLLDLYTFAIKPETSLRSVYTSVDEYKELGVISKDLDADAIKNKIWKPYDFTDIK